MATIEELKKNGQTVYPVTVPEAVRDENGTNLAERLGEIEAEIPDVVDNVTSTAADDAFSAKQGKLLNDRINNLQNIGRFLALWDCTTGLPLTNPSGYPYTYHTGDYFRVNAVGTTNYMPSGTSYQGVASTVVYSGNVAVNDVWFFDGTTWTLQVNHEGGTVQDVQDEAGNSLVSGGIATIPQAVFVAEYGVTIYNEIVAAYNAGKVVVVFYGDTIYGNPVIAANGSIYMTAIVNSIVHQLRIANDDIWYRSTITLQQSKLRTSWGAVPSDDYYPSEKLVYDSIYPTKGSAIPSGGMLPNILYALGTLSGAVTISLATPADANICNHYFFVFDTGATAPTITWDATITSWMGGSAPTINANKHYEVSVLNGVGVYMEV